MKYSLIFLAIVGVATAASVPRSNKVATESLADVLNEFVALFDAAEFFNIMMPYLVDDAQVQAAVEYLTSEPFKQLVDDIDQLPEYRKFLDYTQEAGLDIYKWVNLIHEILGMEPLTRSTSARNGKGIAGLVDEIIEYMPLKELKDLYLEKLETSPEFAEFAARVNSDEFQVIVNAVKDHPVYQDLRAKLVAVGVDVDAIVKILREVIALA